MTIIWLGILLAAVSLPAVVGILLLGAAAWSWVGYQIKCCEQHDRDEKARFEYAQRAFEETRQAAREKRMFGDN